jgi:hypothetical protein
VPVSDLRKLTLIDGLIREFQISDAVSRLDLEDVTLSDFLELLRGELGKPVESGSQPNDRAGSPHDDEDITGF